MKGFNLIGYATSPLGLGEDLRSFAAMLDHLGIPFSVIDLPTESQGQVEVRWRHLSTRDFDTSIFFMSAGTCVRLLELQPQLFEAAKRRIGYFLWELPDVPPEHLPALRAMDQIWCPTRFVQSAFFNAARKLTLALPLPVLRREGQGRDFRAELGIPRNAFVSLYLFDLHSTLARKNPQGVVQAFLRFAQQRPDAHLVLKANRWQDLPAKALAWLPPHPGIHLLKETLDTAGLTDLYRSADCYLSLHRSEGLGRTLVEAMQHGLQIVSTDFSGPADFLTPENALLVRWQRQDVAPGDYPNACASWWADPDIGHAAQQLELALQRSRLGRNQAGIATSASFEPQALAERYRKVLQASL